MSLPRSIHRSPWWVVAGICAWLAHSGWAADAAKKAAPGTETNASEGVRATQRDLDRIRAASDPLLSGLARPTTARVPVPELRTDSVESPLPVAPTTSAIRADKPVKNSSNWLVDAMEQGARERDSRQRTLSGTAQSEAKGARGLAEVRVDSPFAPPRGEQSGDGDRERRIDSNAASRTENQAAVHNPLASYLGNWLTPKDYALLTPGLAGGSAASPLGTGYNEPAPAVGVTTGALGGAPALKSDIPGGFKPALAPSVRSGGVIPRENPFLAGLNNLTPNSVPAAGVILGPAIASTAEAGRPELPIQAMPVPPVTTKIPDVAKPRPDATYFKQLKRF